MLASSSRPITPLRAAGCEDGIHTSGSNSPRLMASSGAGSASGLAVSQPSPASARRWRIGENSASSADSSQVMATSPAPAADRSLEVACTASESGRSAGMTNRSRGRPRPAACLVWLAA